MEFNEKSYKKHVSWDPNIMDTPILPQVCQRHCRKIHGICKRCRKLYCDVCGNIKLYSCHACLSVHNK